MVYILVLNWNGYEDTIECLHSLLRLTYKSYHVVVIDNASTDGSVSQILKWCKINNIQTNIIDSTLESVCHNFNNDVHKTNTELTVIQSNFNKGYAGGNNLGIQYAFNKKADYIWIINNDVVVESNALEEMVKCYINNGRDVILGSNLKDYNEKSRYLNSGGRFNPWVLRIYSKMNVNYESRNNNKFKELDYVVGASMMIKAEILKIIGLLNEDYFLYFEEGEWCLRAKCLGYESKICWDAVVYHKCAKRSVYASPTREYYMSRNSLYFVKQFYPSFIPWLILVQFPYRIASILYRRYPKCIKLIYYNILGILHYVSGRKGQINIT